MKQIPELKKILSSDEMSAKLTWLYSCTAEEAALHGQRYLTVLEALENTFGPHETAALFSAPGRTEIGGNHTDHQHGCVLAGAVNIDMIAAVGRNDLQQLRLKSEGYEPCVIDLNDLEKRPEEENNSMSILRGSCRAFRDRGAALEGIDVYVASNVPKGSGVSSSAAFETLIGTILNALFMGTKKVSPVEIAQIGQWAENVYFGKPCGLMDQMASSVGGVVSIDFADPASPAIREISFDLEKAGLSLCIIDSGADHADLTDEYAAVPTECCQAAALCGKEVLRDVPQSEFFAKIPQLRGKCPDRAILRAIHFYNDNTRACQEADAMEAGRYEEFLQLLNESGHSSWEYLQNITPAGSISRQAVGLTIAAAREILGGRGAVRVHGGGFAGTVQAFVPKEMTEQFRAAIDGILGQGSCHVMSIRPVGGIRLL